MTMTAFSTAVTQTFTVATDSLSTSTGIASLCGAFSYTISPTGFITISGTTITVNAASLTYVGSYTAVLTATLASYPAVTVANKSFAVTIVDPCLTTVLTLPTTFSNFSFTAFSGVPYTMTFSPATDSKATAAGVPSLCGPRVYSIVETTPAAFTTIVPPAAGQEYSSVWTLSELSNDFAHVGVWTMTLRVTL
jgi:hypothetical protein